LGDARLPVQGAEAGEYDQGNADDASGKRGRNFGQQAQPDEEVLRLWESQVLMAGHACGPTGFPSAMIRKQLDRIAKAPHRIFPDALEIEIALDQIGECA